MKRNIVFDLDTKIYANYLSTGKPFVKEMGHLTLVAGTVALIPCLYGGYPVDKIIWRRDGSEIDTKKNKSRFRVLSNGTLQIENIRPGADKGSYSCLVSNRNRETASGTVSINVLRKLNTFHIYFSARLQIARSTYCA